VFDRILAVEDEVKIPHCSRDASGRLYFSTGPLRNPRRLIRLLNTGPKRAMPFAGLAESVNRLSFSAPGI